MKCSSSTWNLMYKKEKKNKVAKSKNELKRATDFVCQKKKKEKKLFDFQSFSIEQACESD